jgi:HSP20 family protein
MKSKELKRMNSKRKIERSFTMALLPVRRKEKDRSELARLHSDMDDLFHGFFDDWDGPFMKRARWPVIDVGENDNAFVIKAEVPGCKAEDIDISVHGNTLTISGEKKHEKEEKDKGYYHVERSYGSFRRDLNLATEINADKIEAVCENGVLTLTLPKSEKAKPVKVKVKGQ